MTVTFLPTTSGVHDEYSRQNFEYLESHAIFDSTGAGGALSGNYPSPTLAAATLQKFLQLAIAGTMAVDFGNNNTGGGSTVTFAHNLGRVPIAVLALPFSNIVGFGGSTTTTITINASATSTTFYWLAIG